MQSLLKSTPGTSSSPLIAKNTVTKMYHQRFPTLSSPKPESGIPLSQTNQPMFKPLIPLIALQLRLCNKLGAIPFEWDMSNGMMRVLRSKIHQKVCLVNMGVHTCYTILMTGYFLTEAVLESMQSSTRMVGLAFLVCFWTTMLTRLTFWHRRKEVTHLINNFITFENAYLSRLKGGYKGDPVTRALMTLGLLTSVGLPGLMCTMLLVNPCKPPHLGYALFSYDGKCVVPNWSIRVVVLAFDTWIWVNCIPPACFFAFQVFLPGLKCLTCYLQLLSGISKSKGIINFNSALAKDHFCFRVYRHLQLLARLYNFCLQTVFIPTQITAACLVIIIGLYACIKLHAQVPMPGFAFFPLLLMDGFSMLLICQAASDVLSRSESFVGDIRTSRGYKRTSWQNKVALATTAIKILFGSSNYIDQMTPLVYLNFCLTQTVSLVLLS